MVRACHQGIYERQVCQGGKLRQTNQDVDDGEESQAESASSLSKGGYGGFARPPEVETADEEPLFPDKEGAVKPRAVSASNGSHLAEEIVDLAGGRRKYAKARFDATINKTNSNLHSDSGQHRVSRNTATRGSH
jgi:hypothetical protein